MSLKKWYGSIGTKDGIFDVEDIKAFRFATGVLICSIVNRQKDHQQSQEVKEFCESFKKEQNLSDKEAKELFVDVKDFDAHIDKQIAVIKLQLKDSNHKKLEFMHTLNRFIVENDCTDGDYTCFQMVLKKLFDT
jgi:septal ring factor EnvC (AmiA/AmiB activator)